MNATPDIDIQATRILIVDDQAPNRRLLQVMLAAEGYGLDEASSGEEALAHIVQHPPDLILLDVMMPRMDGFQVAAALKQAARTRHIPIIMVTALHDREARMTGLEAGAEDFLSKPVDRGELCVRVRNLLRLKAYGQHYATYSQRLEAEVAARTAEVERRALLLEQQAETLAHQAALRKQAEAELVLLTERLSLATRVARVGVWEWNIASNTFIWDDTMFEFYGLPAVKPLPYGLWSGAVHPEDLPAVEASLQKAIATKGSSAAEFRITRSDGAPRTIATMERAIVSEEGEVTGVVGVHMDVTDRRISEQLLTESRAAELRFKDEFLSHVSHELRSPLTAIKQFTGILAGGLAGDLTNEQLEYQQIVVRNVAQLQAMIDDLLEVTRLETGKLTVEEENVSVLDAVSDALNTLRFSALAKGVTLTTELAPDLPNVYADSTRVRQILIILLDNAIKFTTEVGWVVIRAQRWSRNPAMLLISVSDNGCGIEPETAAKIFERLYQLETPQAARKGLGLGLYICKELIGRLGGEIWLDSTPGSGSTFSFTLPVFDLPRLIAPLLHKGRWPTEAASLIVVTAAEPGAGPGTRVGDEWCLQIAGVLRGCLLPNLDVLLPTVRRLDGSARFVIVVFADEAGSVVLARRIHLQLERYQAERPAGPRTSVSYRMLPLTTAVPDGDPEAMAASMAARIELGISEGDASDTRVGAGIAAL